MIAASVMAAVAASPGSALASGNIEFDAILGASQSGSSVGIELFGYVKVRDDVRFTIRTNDVVVTTKRRLKLRINTTLTRSCTRISARSARCKAPAGAKLYLTGQMFAGNDKVTVVGKRRTVYVDFDGYGGGDTFTFKIPVRMDEGNPCVSGGSGNDRVVLAAGTSRGEPCRLVGDAGNDVLSGGVGEGGGGNDRITATPFDDKIDSGPGNDTVNGGGGDDEIDDGPGNDRLNGGAGDDLIDAGLGNDTLNGGAGNDQLNGGAGTDRFDAGPGNDRLHTQDADSEADNDAGARADFAAEAAVTRETVACGAGADEVTEVDRADLLSGCERVAVFGFYVMSAAVTVGADAITTKSQCVDKVATPTCPVTVTVRQVGTGTVLAAATTQLPANADGPSDVTLPLTPAGVAAFAAGPVVTMIDHETPTPSDPALNQGEYGGYSTRLSR